MDAEKVPLKLIIAGKELPVSATPANVELYKEAAVRVNEQIAQFAGRHKGQLDDFIPLAMAAVIFASHCIINEKSSSFSNESLEQLSNLIKHIDNYIATKPEL